MKCKSLRELYELHDGKISDKWSSYLGIYDQLFSPFRDRQIRLLEIGIQNGGSIEIWAKYFSNAKKIVGCDIDEACRSLIFEDPRIEIVIGDATVHHVYDAIAKLSSGYDLVIDDGSHKSRDIVKSFFDYFLLVEDGGFFVAEDLHCSYWKEFDGGLFDPASSISFFKRLADVVNHEHWGISASRVSLFTSFTDKYGVDIDDAALRSVESVHFFNSLCVIRKTAPANVTLGARIIVGERAGVVVPVAQSDSVSISLDQSSNSWSQIMPLPENELASLRLSSAQLQIEYVTAKSEMIVLQSEKSDLQLNKATLEARNEALESNLAQVTRLQQLASNYLEIQQGYGRQKAAQVEEFRFKVLSLEHGITQLDAQLKGNQAMIDGIFASTSWRVSAPVRWAGKRVAPLKRGVSAVRALSRRAGSLPRLASLGWGVFQRSGMAGVTSKLSSLRADGLARLTSVGAALDSGDPYEHIARQIFAEQQCDVDVVKVTELVRGFSNTPLISVIMPVYKTPIQWLRRAVESLQEQYYENWELCVVDDCSPTSEQRELLMGMAALDSRIRVKVLEVNSGISAASSAALDMARGEFFALVDHDDELTKDAFYWIVSEINRNSDVDFIYTDECKIDDTDQRRLFHFVFKPDWAPEILFNGMLTGHLTVYKTDTVRALGGFRSKFDFSQDYDLALRMSEVARKIVHIERVLYLWRSIPGSAASGGKDFARESNIGALNAALVRRSIPGIALPLDGANCVRIALPEAPPLVSIVIPSDSVQNLRTALDAIRSGTEYPSFEVIVVCNGPLAERLKDEYADVSNFSFVHYNKKYNFSDKCNEGARAANGEFVVFYNDDVFPAQPDWVQRLIEYLYVPGVEGVSPKLLYENNTIQYAGMISGTPGLVGTAYNNTPRDGGDSFLTMHRYVRNVSVLSGACCVMRKSVFWDVGGFDSVNTPDGHSDMDLSYKLIEAGYRCVYTPYSVLYHIGNHSWNIKRGKYKADIFALKRWGGYVSRDPNFTESMKRVLYRDFQFSYRIFADHVAPDASYEGPDVLFVSHELSLTGAPRMLFYAALAVQQRGGFPVVVAPIDGPIRSEFEAAGIAVIVDASVRDNHFLFERFARNFDVVVVNTMALAKTVHQLSAIEGLDVIWWLHEAKAIAKEPMIARVEEWDSVRIMCVSDYALDYLPVGVPGDVLHNGIPDSAPVIAAGARRSACMTFVMAGTLEKRKAQDLFVEAIALLPERVRENCQFLLSGKLWDDNRSYWESVQADMERMPEIKYLGSLTHREQLDLIARSDVLVCCSRDESFSLVVTEAAMLGKPSIFSTSVGVADVLEDGVSCTIFESENASALATKMLDAFDKRDSMARIGEAARSVFERELTLEVFSDNFFQILLKKASMVPAILHEG